MRTSRSTVAAAALSEHPIPAHAAGDVIGEVLDRLDGRADLAAVFVTGNHAGALEDVASTVRTVLRPRTLIGAAGSGVLGGHREVEGQPGISLWAARCGDTMPVRIRTARMETGWAVTGLPTAASEGRRVLVLLGDPHSFPADGFLDELSRTCPDLEVVGGLTSGSLGPGGSRLVVDDDVCTSGAVGVLLERDADVTTLVSQGCRPVGEPFVVTRADGHHLLELGGVAATDRLREMLEDLPPDERAAATRGLQIGAVIDEQRDRFGAGDFLVRGITGVDLASGAVSVADATDVGRTVQFHLRDAHTADDDLRSLLTGTVAEGALVFPGTGRGQALFGYPDHDADVVSTSLGSRATAGVFAAGEIGPVRGRSLLHGVSAAMALFGPRPA